MFPCGVVGLVLVGVISSEMKTFFLCAERVLGFFNIGVGILCCLSGNSGKTP